MEFYNKILCVTFEELTGGDEPVIKGNTLSQNVCRGNIQCARQARGEGNYALYVYASLPKKYRMRFVEKYGEVYAVVLDTFRTVKILRKSSTPGMLKFVPVNKEEFDEQEFSISRILQVYEVVGSIRRFF